jgi:hypothetical protein
MAGTTVVTVTTDDGTSRMYIGIGTLIIILILLAIFVF